MYLCNYVFINLVIQVSYTVNKFKKIHIYLRIYEKNAFHTCGQKNIWILVLTWRLGVSPSVYFNYRNLAGLVLYTLNHSSPLRICYNIMVFAYTHHPRSPNLTMRPGVFWHSACTWLCVTKTYTIVIIIYYKSLFTTFFFSIRLICILYYTATTTTEGHTHARTHKASYTLYKYLP